MCVTLPLCVILAAMFLVHFMQRDPFDAVVVVGSNFGVLAVLAESDPTQIPYIVVQRVSINVVYACLLSGLATKAIATNLCTYMFFALLSLKSTTCFLPGFNVLFVL